jgi:hypothetical protein
VSSTSGKIIGLLARTNVVGGFAFRQELKSIEEPRLP